MRETLLVGAGGCIGSIARYLSGVYFLSRYPGSLFPWGTFFVNLVGCFLIGVCAGLLQKFPSLESELRLFLMVGVLGGFTTFSAFGLETWNLFRSGSAPLALVYIGSSVIAGLILVFCGTKVFS